MMLEGFAYYPIFGVPLLAVGGMFTFLLMLATASIPRLNAMRVTKIPIVWHFRLAYLTLALGFMHGLLWMLTFL